MRGTTTSSTGPPDRLRGLRAFTRWSLLAYALLIPLAPVLAVVQATKASPGWAVFLPLLLVFTLLHGWLLMRGMNGYGHAHWRDRGILVTQGYSLALWGAAVAVDTHPLLAWSVPPLATAGAVAALLPRVQRWVQGAVMVVSTLALSQVGGFRPALLVPVLLFAAMMVWPAPMQVWLWDVGLQLDRARATEAELAVVTERLRFAADLHDILGHSLEVIALKAELATRLPDAAAAREAMTEVRDTAQDALREVREVVRGYRRADLATELTGVRSLLHAAGIHCRITGEPHGVDPERQAVLGTVLREAITNVLRHAQATECSIGFETSEEEVRLVVVNDGATGVAGDGTGLAGLAARLEAVGGRFRAAPEPGGRFRVWAAVPAGGGAAA
ncbi:two-component system, NarL family, sensor histidine kinase DesK [Streptoalloteichus tenebrarius]|uniref:Two-component system, NarL family, sensor histidine kinase DesK n=1 Tax=Streptoalloteichus tenebrarius (strain ATCC 17920 / DSM 40477 / JCM 4838 / CBS 697.72 / NBRC 16177 / NCIMB 11028 / NRRL B-12390 / A12253. 1 / ISP 5477) TaxID=1933 RepID=A0ABT1HVD6_STRSD|nr:histidine kinase [Streptoalloteichus tenebrarius]MCP2259486.1 two-component system, NarL family, sensor histidine kinase DesK [Streptoalloteichus tenebrarius]BFF01434.1 hypothetical protein GCM10020241_31090 [Streptoalloteichus tenebrarius]